MSIATTCQSQTTDKKIPVCPRKQHFSHIDIPQNRHRNLETLTNTVTAKQVQFDNIDVYVVVHSNQNSAEARKCGFFFFRHTYAIVIGFITMYSVSGAF